MQRIKYLIMDVDGTLTDGKIYMGETGESFKAFNIKDGCGIKEILPEHNITPVIITARESLILDNRCKEIGINEVYQGFRQKLRILNEFISEKNVDLSEVAYIGDDNPDIQCMKEVVAHGGVVLCPADAIPEIKVIANYVSPKKAGEGAVRDCIDYLVNNTGSYKHLNQRINTAMGYILRGEFEDKPDGKLPDGSRYSIQEYMTKDEEKCVIETHRYHIDIQYIIEGKEAFKMYEPGCLLFREGYDEIKDVEFWNGTVVAAHSVLSQGSMIVIKNRQPHKGCIRIGNPERVRKLVCKVDIRL